MEEGERRGSRSSKKRCSAGPRDIILPWDYDTPLVPLGSTTPPRTPPKHQLIESIHKALKLKDSLSTHTEDAPDSPKKSPSSPKPNVQAPKKLISVISPVPSPKPSPKPVEPEPLPAPVPMAPIDVDPFNFTDEDKPPEAGLPPVRAPIAPLPLPAIAPPAPTTSSSMDATIPPPVLNAVVEQKSQPPRTIVTYSTEPFLAEKEPSSPRPRVLFALTGSVAAIKLNDILTALTKTADVIVVATKSAEHFIADFGDARFDGVRFFNDNSEYSMWHARNDPVLHIELRKWADIFLIAPLSANSLAKLANGLCDNLVTSIARAWDFERPFYIAPAMNTLMWTHAFTQKHLTILEELGIKTIHPVQKTLMCGDKGVGAMADVLTIIEEVRSAISFHPRRH